MAIALAHRMMTMVLLWAATRVWVAIPAWEPLLRPWALGRHVRIDWMPVPACVAALRGAYRPRQKAYVDGAQPLIGHFGSYGGDVSALLVESLPAIMESTTRPSLLLIGARSEVFRRALLERHPAWSARVHATGYVPPADLTQHLEACDVFLQPYPDGVTSRRTSAMACLALGLPIVTTSGHLTEALWETSRAVRLAPVSDPDALASAVVNVIESPDERMRLARSGLRLYNERFTVDSVAATLRAAAIDQPSGPAPECA
jgi:glycosyltransferase involved in cell wall biosynthesis